MEMPVFMMDLSFCTVHSWKLATIMAYTRLEEEIRLNFSERKAGAAGLNQNGVLDGADHEKIVRLQWTDPNMALVELIHAFKNQGSFNHGKADLKTITAYFEHVFGVKFSNFSKSYQDILCRKKSHTSYLDKLRDSLNRGIDENEERGRR